MLAAPTTGAFLLGRSPMLKHFLNPPNWFTSASMFCSFYSILLATGAVGAEPNFYRAAWMLVFAGVFDMLDGRVARLTGTGSPFGIQLDSLADIVSFGIAPAVLIYTWALADLGPLGLGISFFFFLCGAFRLARFNLAADGTKSSFSTGLTITMAGGTVASLVMASAANDLSGSEIAGFASALTLALSLLMVSRLRFFEWSALRLRPRTMFGLAVGIALVLVVSMRFRYASAFLAIAGIYLTVSMAWNVVLLFRKEARQAGEDLLGIDLQSVLPEEEPEPEGDQQLAAVEIRRDR